MPHCFGALLICLEVHHGEIEDWSMREAGVPRYWAGVGGPSEELRQAASLASFPRGQVLPSTQPRLSFTRRIPVGVVGVIAPFNAPLMLAVRSLAPALAVGNAVVLKPDPRTAVCGGVLLARISRKLDCRPTSCMFFRVGQTLGASW